MVAIDNLLLQAAACFGIMNTAVTDSELLQCSRYYTVQKGDYCNKISAEQHVSTFQLATVNKGIINEGCTNLYPDQKLCLGMAGQDCNKVVIVNGDCNYMASVTRTTVKDLVKLNPNLGSPGNCHVYPGEVICVAPPH